MYKKYHTKGFVLKSSDFGESSKLYKIFTRELGLIMASARSSRSQGAKLKAGLEEYSSGDFTFIKSKNGWKVTDAIPKLNIYFYLNGSPAFLICARSFNLLQKLLQGEDPDIFFFDQFYHDIDFVIKNPQLPSDLLKNLECLIVLRVLNKLGYLERDPWQDFVLENLNREIIGNFSSFRENSIKSINQSLKESQLIS